MKKREFAVKLLALMNKFAEASETERKKLGKDIAAFFKKNFRFDDGGDAFTDADFREIDFVFELGEYSKAAFPEDDFFRGKLSLELLIKKK